MCTLLQPSPQKHTQRLLRCFWMLPERVQANIIYVYITRANFQHISTLNGIHLIFARGRCILFCLIKAAFAVFVFWRAAATTCGSAKRNRSHLMATSVACWLALGTHRASYHFSATAAFLRTNQSRNSQAQTTSLPTTNPTTASLVVVSYLSTSECVNGSCG